MQRRILPLLIVLTLIAAACSSGADGASMGTNDLPKGGPDEVIAAVIADGRPAVINIWASWCGPCRSEAPLLSQAFAEYGDDVHFIGVDVQDTQAGAQAFIAEFGLPFDHFFDQNRSVPAAFGGFGVPITYFLDSDGNVVGTHSGILDEHALVQGIEDLLAGA
jgi:thiol-disulfide isomerase/thioredoxin